MKRKTQGPMTITDKNGNEFYVIPAAEYQPQPSPFSMFLALIGCVAISTFFMVFLTRAAKKIFL